MHVPKIPRSRRVGLLTVAVACSLLLAACGDKKEKAASQTAAKVNKEEVTVHQINFVLQQQRNLRPEQAEAASRQVLERLIDQELAVQKADELKLDRDPRVVQQLEAVRRDVLARAYAEKVGESASKPTAEEIKKYYDENPALFSARRIYSLQELQIEAPAGQYPALRDKLTQVKNVAEFVEHLRALGLRFSGNQAVRSAEQLPLASLRVLSQMRDGQAMLSPTANGAVMVVLAGSRAQPVSEEQARPAIEQFLVNDRKRKLIEEDRKALRAAATIQYVGKFADGAASAPAAAAASEPVAEPTAAPATAPLLPPEPPASGGLDADTVTKGLGIKQ